MSVWEGVNGAAGHLVDGLASCAASVSDLGRLASVAGMIVPYVVAYSLMFGAVISSGIMWPLFITARGPVVRGRPPKPGFLEASLDTR